MSHRRSANTCAECRARKVKCDGRRVVCTPCERLHLRCSFERVGDEGFADPDPEATRGKRRAKAACHACQASKIRCSGELPRCRRCITKAQNCVYSASRRNVPRKDPAATPQSHTSNEESGSHVLPTSSPSGQSELRFALTRGASSNTQENSPSKLPVDVASVSPLLDDALIMRMFDSFFQHLQPMPVFSCFHKVSLFQRFEAGLLNPGLILAIIGTTCDMLDMGPSMKELGHSCLIQAETLVMKDIGTPSAVKIQALILIIKAHLRQSQLMQAFVLFGIASRFAFALKLNHEAPKLCFLEQESRRRLMWSLYIVDSSLCGGIREFSLCPAESIYIQLPCQERNFEFDLQQVTEPLQVDMNQHIPDSIGSLGMYIRVCWLRYRILQTTKEAVLSQDGDIGNLPAKLDQLAMDLTNFEASLPESFKFSKRNLQLRAYSPRVCPYLMIHIWLRQCHCDLYRVVLTGLKEALREAQIQQLHPSVVMYYRWKCYESAEKLADVLESVRYLKEGLFSLDTTIPICAYQCVRLLLQCFRQCDRTHGSITEDTLSRLIQQCVTAVEASPLTSSIEKRIVSTNVIV